jgi:hypothetical protein
VLLKTVYLLTCRVLSLAVLVFRSDLAKDAPPDTAKTRMSPGGSYFEQDSTRSGGTIV